MGRVLRIAGVMMGLLSGTAFAQTLPPPRSVADITAILDQEKPDLAKIAAQAKIADAAPPANLSGLVLARFYAGRAAAAEAIGRVGHGIADLHKALEIGFGRCAPTRRPCRDDRA